MQPVSIPVVGGSNPSLATLAPPAAAAKGIRQGSNRRLQIWRRLCYHWITVCVNSIVRPHCL